MKVTKIRDKEFEIENSEIVKSVLTLDQVNAEIASMEGKQAELERQLVQVQESLNNVLAHKKDMKDILKEMKKQI